MPPAGAVNYIPWAMVGYVFQYLVRRRNFSYWAKYNCEWNEIACKWSTQPSDPDVLSAALDAGTGVGIILVFFWYVSPSFFDSDLTKRYKACNTQIMVRSGDTRYRHGGATQFLNGRWTGTMQPTRPWQKGKNFGSLLHPAIDSELTWKIQSSLGFFWDRRNDFCCIISHLLYQCFHLRLWFYFAFWRVPVNNDYIFCGAIYTRSWRDELSHARAS